MQVTRLLSPNMVKGDIIPLQTTQERHYHGLPPREVPESTAVNFADALNRALEQVNDQQIEAEKLAIQMVADPGSVEAHTVMLAAEKARMALTLTKNLADLAIRAYRELVNLR
ncbi:MAG: flagellar hook-basal body complex protein FliE [Leptospiraceae bacterium]|nr:flagellar hook-basal body complex protein FliE [Leptospiraceae bacterium]MDW8305969.1 flagellar hook-basal body complex protein FliE [Leptospiraceae bacterium]